MSHKKVFFKFIFCNMPACKHQNLNLFVPFQHNTSSNMRGYGISKFWWSGGETLWSLDLKKCFFYWTFFICFLTLVTFSIIYGSFILMTMKCVDLSSSIRRCRSLSVLTWIDMERPFSHPHCQSHYHQDSFFFKFSYLKRVPLKTLFFQI